MKQQSRAPRRRIQRPVLCRIQDTLQCWAAVVQDFSLSGARLTGLPPGAPLSIGAKLHMIEGLENQQIQHLAPILKDGSLSRLNAYIKKITQEHEFRQSLGEVLRINQKSREFAVFFRRVEYEERFYPRAQRFAAQMKGIFSFEDKKGILKCHGKFTPGAAIDLARDVIHDVQQCMLLLDLTQANEYSRIGAEKFCIRLRVDLTEQDYSHTLALVVPEDWPQEDFPDLRLFLDPKEALDSLTMPEIPEEEDAISELAVEGESAEGADAGTDGDPLAETLSSEVPESSAT